MYIYMYICIYICIYVYIYSILRPMFYQKRNQFTQPAGGESHCDETKAFCVSWQNGWPKKRSNWYTYIQIYAITSIIR